MKELACPVCKKQLILSEKTYKCENNHCFDISKYGVVNLSLNNKSSKKRHGDDKLMVVSRKDFLDKGYYEPILNAVCSLAKKHCAEGSVLLDAGCGEGYYTFAIAKTLNTDSVYGVDISKEALRYFKKRLPFAQAIVSSIFKLPIANESVDVLINMFAPDAGEEFLRVIKSGGFLIRTFVLRNHLIELKKAVYDNAYYNDEENTEIEGFSLVKTVKTERKICITGNENIKNLFCMTPYYYKTSENDQKKLQRINEINVTLQVMTCIYKKL